MNNIKKVFRIWGLLIAILGISLSTFANPNSLKEATELAKKENKVILLSFSGSDWCRSCMLLKKTILDTPKFKEFAKDNLVIVEVDFPRLKKNQLPEQQQQINEKLAAQYNPQGKFPAIVLLDKNQKVLGTTGYKKISPEEYIEHLKSIIK